MKRLFTDMLVSILLGLIFKFALTPAYKEHKKNSDGKNVIVNALTELTYNGAGACFDTFMGPYAVLDYFGNSTNPSTYKWQSRVMNDLGSFLVGNKNFTELMMNSQAFPRSFQDTYKMWVRDNEK